MRSRISIIMLSFFVAVVISGVFTACKQESEQTSQSEADVQRTQQPALTRTSVVLKTLDEAREFVRTNLPKPIPDDYKIPVYISSELPLEQVYDTLEKKYPDFYGLDGETYLRAIMKAPDRYLKMSLESKSIRRYYDPNSRY